MAHYEMTRTLKGNFDDVKIAVVHALKEQGFGVLTQIDVQKTMRDKLGAAFERYEILGVCNPQLAHQALEADRTVGVLLPCNVVVRESGSGVVVSMQDPETLFDVMEPALQAKLAALPGEAKRRLRTALDALPAD